MFEYLFECINAVYLFGARQIPPYLFCFAVFCAKYLVFIVPISLIIIWLVYKFQSIKMLMEMAISMIIAIIMAYLIGKIYYTDRPFVANANLLLIDHDPTGSFPSDHALLYSIYFYLLLGFQKHLKLPVIFIIIAFLSGILICWSRVFLSLHYVSDIIGGWLLGLVSIYSAKKLLRQLRYFNIV